VVESRFWISPGLIESWFFAPKYGNLNNVATAFSQLKLPRLKRLSEW
jgi:hypothetical protein